MDKLFESIQTPYVDSQTLLACMQGYRNPRDRVSRMVKRGELVRLKNGIFLIKRRLEALGAVPYEQIANFLYGPSYVSLEWALSFYGLIPERVSVITSVTTGSSKEYATSIGLFTYRRLSPRRYAIGLDHKQIPGQVGGFLIATPEKALADWVFFTSQKLRCDELKQDLIEAKRIEEQRLRSLNLSLLGDIALQYRSQTVKNLVRFLRSL